MRALCFVLVVFAALACTGCTFLGMGIGALVPTYEDVTDLQPSVGHRVRLFDRDGEVIVRGELEGYRDGQLIVDGERIPIASVWRAQRKDGTRWLRGALIGLAIDGSIALFVLALSQIRLSSEMFGGSFGS